MSAHHHRAGQWLRRRLEWSAELAGCTFDVARQDDSAWNSPTFAGGQHAIKAVVPLNGRAWLDQIDEYAVMLPGYVLMQLDVGVVEEKDGMLHADLEALTVKKV